MYRFLSFCVSIAHVLRPSSFAVKRRSHILYLPSSIVALSSLFLLLSSFISLLSVTPLYAATYYIDATGGKDTNDGLAQTTAWKTIAKVNASSFRPGDQILFKKGETWREQLTVPSSGSAGNPITYGAFGNGALPVISSAGLVSSWTVYSGNIWQAALTTEPKLVYFDGTFGTNVASIVLCNGANKWHWESNVLYIYSTSDPGSVYTNPGIEAAKRSYAIYASSKSYITLDGLDLRHGNTTSYGTVTFYQASGASQTGITVKNSTVIGSACYGIAVWRTDTVSIDNNTVSDCLGMYGTIRASAISTGNSGLSITNNTVHDSEFGISSVDYDTVTISGNTVYNIQRYGINHNAQNRSTTVLTINNNEVHDTPLAQTATAYSEVGYGGTNPYTATGVSVHDNYLHDAKKAGSQIDGACIMSDLGSSTALSPALVYRNRLVNCQGGCIQVQGGTNDNVGTKVYYNIMSGCGVDGVGATQRATVGVGGGATSVLIYNNSSYAPYRGIRVVGSSTATAKNNIIDGAVDTNLLQETGSTLTSNYNDYSTDGAAMFSLNGTRHTFAYWKTNSSQDANSLNADPLFLSTSNLRLQATSTLINAGTDVGLTSDYEGNHVPFGPAPDIGAYEYNSGLPKLQPPVGLRVL